MSEAMQAEAAERRLPEIESALPGLTVQGARLPQQPQQQPEQQPEQQPQQGTTR
ncbi:MAG TPA: hypothetical protein VF952_21000 [Chloroflexia bacterium]